MIDEKQDEDAGVIGDDANERFCLTMRLNSVVGFRSTGTLLLFNSSILFALIGEDSKSDGFTLTLMECSLWSFVSDWIFCCACSETVCGVMR